MQHYYIVSAADDADVVILNVGDDVEIVYNTETAGTLVPAYGVTMTAAPAAPPAETPAA